MSDNTAKTKTMPFVAMLLAWMIPGAGHVYLGRTWRGILIFVLIAATFWSGVAMGGVLTVDYYGERWWFIAQMCAGLHGVMSWHRQQQAYQQLLPEVPKSSLDALRSPEITPQQMLLDERLASEKIALVTPVDTVARAYTGVAGLLNLLCVFDAVILSMMGIYGETSRKSSDDDAAGEVAEAS